MKRPNESFTVQFMNAVNYIFPAENHMVILLVLKGEVTLGISGLSPEVLQEGYVQVINPDREWLLKSEHNNLVAIVRVSSLLIFNAINELPQTLFYIKDHRQSNEELRLKQLIQHIALTWLKRRENIWKLEVNRYLSEALSILIQHFSHPDLDISLNNLTPRISKIVSLLENEFRRKITLQQLAAQLHVTESHLSRIFTKETGENFSTFLTNIRFKNAVNEIATTTRPIGNIINECGFSSTRRFSSLFYEKYGTQPRTWRQNVKTGKIPHYASTKLSSPTANESAEYSELTLFSLLSEGLNSSVLEHNSGRHAELKPIIFNPQVSGTPLKKRHYVITIGYFKELLKQHIQQQLICLKEKIPSFQVEISNPFLDPHLFTDLITGETNPTWTPWSNLDLATNFLKTNDIHPIIRLMPSLESFENEEYIKKLSKFIHHNILLLGKKVVHAWSFIIDMSLAKIFHFEKRLAFSQELIKLIRAILPNCRIGFTLVPQTSYETPLLNMLERHIDFIGLSLSTNNPQKLNDYSENNPPQNHLITRDQIIDLLKLFKKHRIRAPLYLQSWSTLTGNTLTTNGLFFRGALLMDMILSLPEEVKMLGLWLNSDLQNEILAGEQIENNSLALFHIATSKRPIFHIISLRERLTGAVFSSDPCWIATRDDDIYRLLLINPVIINPSLSIKEHLLNEYTKKFSLQLLLNSAGIWRIKQWMFDQNNGALYHQIGQHATLYDRDEETINYINQRSEPTFYVSDERIVDSWSRHITLNINAVCFIEIFKVSDEN